MPPTVFPERPATPTPSQIESNLQKCLDIQNEAVSHHNKRPFAALLVGPDNTTVLLSHYSISHVDHAEACLARLASIHYTQPFLWTCTLYSTWEPCAMCTGTLYWANIGRLVYAASEDDLKSITSEGNEENFTMSLACRDVLDKGQKDIQVWGPVEGMRGKVVRESDVFWKPIREGLGGA